MLAELLLLASCCGESPDGLHLLAAVLALHVFVVEGVLVAASLWRFACPEYDFGGVGESTSAQVRGRVWFLPDYVVQETEPVPEQSHADARIDVQRS